MEREKTEAERQQEENDAAMARRLQEELDRQEGQRASSRTHPSQRRSAPSAEPLLTAPAQTPLPSDGVRTVACRACTFLNNVKHPVAGKRYACEQCCTPLQLPSSPPTGCERIAKEDRLVECKICHSMNRVPDRKTDAVLCGACYQELGTRLDAPAAAEPITPATEHRTVQIRCGQCSAVNAVQVSADAKVVQFECGGCSTINEVTLS